MDGSIRVVSEVALLIVGRREAKDLRPGDWIDKAPPCGKWRRVLAVRPQPGRVPLEIALQAMGEGSDFLVFLLPDTAVQVAKPR